MSELNLQSIANLPVIEGVADGDYIVTVSGGKGKLLPAGNFSGGGGGADVVVTSTDSITFTYQKGTYETLAAKLDSGACPVVQIGLLDSGMTTWLSPALFVYVPGQGAFAQTALGTDVIAVNFLPDGTVVVEG